MDFHDKLVQAGIVLDTTKVLQMMTFTNDDGQMEHVQQPCFDPLQNYDKMLKWWSWYEWYQNLCSKSFICITKNQLCQTQKQLEFHKSSHLSAFVAMEHHAAMQRPDDISDMHTHFGGFKL